MEIEVVGASITCRQCPTVSAVAETHEPACIVVPLARGRVPYFYVALCIVSTVPCRLYKGRGTISYLLNPIDKVREVGRSCTIGFVVAIVVLSIGRKVVPRAVGGRRTGICDNQNPIIEFQLLDFDY